MCSLIVFTLHPMYCISTPRVMTNKIGLKRDTTIKRIPTYPIITPKIASMKMWIAAVKGNDF